MDAGAKTLYVKADSTGDVATLHLAMHSAVPGDTVLVAPGVYELRTSVPMQNGVRLISEVLGGAKIVPFHPEPAIGGISCGGTTAYTEISGFWFDGFVYGDGMGPGSAIGIAYCYDVYIFNNLFTNNDAGVTLGGEWVELFNNTFVGNTKSVAGPGSAGRLFNNILWDPAEGLQWMAVLCNDVANIENIPENFRVVNFSADPLFCGAEDFRLQPDSPCSPGNGPIAWCDDVGLDLVGAFGPGCTPTPVRTMTWGEIKALMLKSP